ncbi:MAG: hypothetical protein HY690_10435 [Chloroflexi bacterium]|nr:hypothetical protein [Chloroflexota bacterium]
MDYQRQQGGRPEDVSAPNVGYGLRSTAPDGSVRDVVRDWKEADHETGWA